MPFTDFVVKQICVNLRYRWTFEVKWSCEPFSLSCPFSLITGTVLLRPRASWCWPCSQTPVCPEWKPGLFSSLSSPSSLSFLLRLSLHFPIKGTRTLQPPLSEVQTPEFSRRFIHLDWLAKTFLNVLKHYQNNLGPYIEKRELRKKEALLNVYFQKLRFKELVSWVSPPFPAIVHHLGFHLFL